MQSKFATGMKFNTHTHTCPDVEKIPTTQAGLLQESHIIELLKSCHKTHGN